MTKSTYRVDPIKDLSFAREFMETPVGLHSAGLHRVLNVFRGEPLAGKYVLVEIEPHRQSRLARLTGERGRPVIHLDTVFTDLLAAERAVGVGDDELIGDFGLIGRGAAGLELDRAGAELGTPPNAYILASSEGHTNAYWLVPEEFLETGPALGGDENPQRPR